MGCNTKERDVSGRFSGRRRCRHVQVRSQRAQPAPATSGMPQDTSLPEDIATTSQAAVCTATALTPPPAPPVAPPQARPQAPPPVPPLPPALQDFHSAGETWQLPAAPFVGTSEANQHVVIGLLTRLVYGMDHNNSLLERLLACMQPNTSLLQAASMGIQVPNPYHESAGGGSAGSMHGHCNGHGSLLDVSRGVGTWGLATSSPLNSEKMHTSIAGHGDRSVGPTSAGTMPPCTKCACAASHEPVQREGFCGASAEAFGRGPESAARTRQMHGRCGREDRRGSVRDPVGTAFQREATRNGDGTENFVQAVRENIDRPRSTNALQILADVASNRRARLQDTGPLTCSASPFQSPTAPVRSCTC
jgi:hypothetical protein